MAVLTTDYISLYFNDEGLGSGVLHGYKDGRDGKESGSRCSRRRGPREER